MKEYTITVFTENQTGLLSRVVSVFTRRHINIESITASKSSIPGIHRLTIVVMVEKDMAEKLVAQIEKQIDVVKAFYDDNSKLVYQEIALYKVPTSNFLKGNAMEKLVRKHNARILEIEEKYIVIEKTGRPSETEALLIDLQKTGVYEFVRSGRVAVIRPMERLNKYLKSLEEAAVEN